MSGMVKPPQQEDFYETVSTPRISGLFEYGQWPVPLLARISGVDGSLVSREHV